jgi:hypothetical protein
MVAPEMVYRKVYKKERVEWTIACLFFMGLFGQIQ